MSLMFETKTSFTKAKIAAMISSSVGIGGPGNPKVNSAGVNEKAGVGGESLLGSSVGGGGDVGINSSGGDGLDDTNGGDGLDDAKGGGEGGSSGGEGLAEGGVGDGGDGDGATGGGGGEALVGGPTGGGGDGVTDGGGGEVSI